MNWLVDIGLFALVGICSYFGIEHHLDSKANKLSQGNEEDRRDAEVVPDVLRKCGRPVVGRGLSALTAWCHRAGTCPGSGAWTIGWR